MASVTQKIPNYIAGISEQPDELKFPGQVRDLLNCVPDVTRQLVKRPGSRFVMDVDDTANGSWSSYYRDPDNQYIILIRRDGTVAVYNVADPGGTPPSVTGFAAPFKFGINVIAVAPLPITTIFLNAVMIKHEIIAKKPFMGSRN